MKKSENTVVILGCGWLGQIVGTALVKNGSTVYGSFRRTAVEEKLKHKGIHGFELDFNNSTTLPAHILEKATHVLTFITPSASTSQPYHDLLHNLLQQFRNDVRVIFSSSTGVYPKTTGTYTEDFEIDPSLPNRLFPAERTLQALLGDRLTILRLAGLIGPERHPAYSLSGRAMKDDGSNPVNLIHSNDIVSAIELLIENDYFGDTYNLCSPEHPPKKEYYSEAANYFGIEPPVFGESHAVKRLIEGNCIEKYTSFRYSHALDNFDDFLR